MFDMFMTREYITLIVFIAITSLLIYINPSYLQNKRYKNRGDSCPNGLWYALILFIIGTVMYYVVNQYF